MSDPTAVSKADDKLVDQCLAVLRHRPAGVLTDIDGTISMIAPTPDAASVSDQARDALRKLAGSLDVVATISGRAAANAEAMVGIPGCMYIGNHGLEQRARGVTVVHPDALFATDAIAAALASVRIAAERIGVSEGILYENKGVTASVHYRLAPDQEGARLALLPLIKAEAEVRSLRVTEGRMVIEIRPRVTVNKGTALTSIVREFGLRGLLFLGDDVTDVDAMRALTSIREAGEIDGLNIAVVAAESLPEVAKAADATVRGVESCVALLATVADRLAAARARGEEP
jgi:trehalose 6-phosphate phosphatase